MKQYPVKNDAASLARSHSVESNARLTALCAFSSLCFGGSFAGIGYHLARTSPVALGVGVVCAVFFAACVWGLAAFRR